MIQVPSIQNPYQVYPMAQQQYMQNPMYMPQPQAPQADYNAVKIAINGASVQAPGAQQAQVGGYAVPTMPYYSYPQADLYSYPQAVQQPYYMPAQTVMAPVAMAPAQAPEMVQQAAPQPAPMPPVPPVQPQVIQQNLNAPAAVAVPGYQCIHRRIDQPGL